MKWNRLRLKMYLQYIHYYFCNKTSGSLPDWKEEHIQDRVKCIVEHMAQKGQSYSSIKCEARKNSPARPINSLNASVRDGIEG